MEKRKTSIGGLDNMKKICERGLNWFQIYNYKGDVRQCSWTEDGYIGNLQESSVEEIYHSQRANQIRERLETGDYSQCKVDACPYLAMNELDKHMIEYEDTPEYPTELYLGFERVCNYACTCCTVHKCMIDEKKENLEQCYAKIEERLQPLLPHLKKISANGCGELFCSKHTLNILANWKPLAPKEEIEVLLESNGSLFDEQHWKQIENLGQYHLSVAISVMSFDEAIYQYLSGTTLPISRIMNNLNFICSLREKGIVNYFEIATVVQEQNFRLLPSFVKQCLEYNPDYIRLRPYESWGAQSQEEVWLTDVRNPEHPYYKEYKKVMQDPILKHPLVHDWSGGLDTVNKSVFPYKLDSYKLQIITELYNNYEAIKKKLGELTDEKEVIVYGIGIVGEVIIQKLLEHGYNVTRIIDQYSTKEEYNGIPVSTIENTNSVCKNNLVIITPIVRDKYIYELLDHNGFMNIASVKDLMSNCELSENLKEI